MHEFLTFTGQVCYRQHHFLLKRTSSAPAALLVPLLLVNAINIYHLSTALAGFPAHFFWGWPEFELTDRHCA